MEIKKYPGQAFPLGATWTGKGVNFALYSENAKEVILCLFSNDKKKKKAERIHLTERTGHIWHVFIDGVKPGQLYGYYVNGPFEPENGMRFNVNKLLIDPNAKAIAGTVEWNSALFGYKHGDEAEDMSFSEEDSTPFVPKAVVIDPAFDWEGDRRLNTPWHKTIIYELHVKGFTKLHPDIPENIRGTYAGLAHPASIKYLKELGVTAVELLPVHYFLDNHMLTEKGLSNYWGYDSIGFFAPDNRYSTDAAAGAQVNEFKSMVKELHKAGIEVILDVVFNHTAEGNHMGPTISFKGIDNSVYYRLAEDRRYYMDYTGTGNTLNVRMPAVLRLIMDSLRYWVQEMHVDGFRFDLAAALAREHHDVDKLSAFFDIIYQDPVISQVKLIAEPWDVGEGGYQVGNFPPEWSEWNGKYRDCIRDYWRGADSMLAEFAERFTGSSDLYKDDARRPTASINFITAHDGFTLNDLVSYNEKHNEANGEDNRDGDSNNRSWNCGVEGPTDDVEVIKLRNRQKRNLLATLFLSQGVPMLVAGDEIGRTQQGNNNAYCQDNEISWLDWQNADKNLLEFTKRLIKLASAHPVFQHKGWFRGKKIRGSAAEDVAWFKPAGDSMTDDDWNAGYARSLGVYLDGKGFTSTGPKGEALVDDSFYLMFNAHYEPINYKLPEQKYGDTWTIALATTESYDEQQEYTHGAEITVEGRSVMVMINRRRK